MRVPSFSTELRQNMGHVTGRKLDELNLTFAKPDAAYASVSDKRHQTWWQPSGTALGRHKLLPSEKQDT